MYFKIIRNTIFAILLTTLLIIDAKAQQVADTSAMGIIEDNSFVTKS